jgi:LPXTG-motif cell wall-anchored protein
MGEVIYSLRNHDVQFNKEITMNRKFNLGRLIAKAFLYGAGFAAFFVGAIAQDATKTTVHHHKSQYEIAVRNATVVYVEGSDLVLKLEGGKIEHVVVPDSDEFIINGKNVSVHALAPGTRLTQTITTTTTPRYVNTVRILEGKVWHVNAPGSVIVSLPDGTNHRYSVPKHARFIVNGEPKTVFELRKGMSFKATIITDQPQTVLAEDKVTVGRAPEPATPPMVGVLLVQPLQARATESATQRASVPEPITIAESEQPATVLPKTGSPLPLAGLLGALSVATSLGLVAMRKHVTA